MAQLVITMSWLWGFGLVLYGIVVFKSRRALKRVFDSDAELLVKFYLFGFLFGAPFAFLIGCVILYTNIRDVIF